MDKKIEFNEALSALIEYATVNGNIVTKADVTQYFKSILDNDDMYYAVYKYLSESNIKVEGYTANTSSPATTEDNESSKDTIGDITSEVIDKVKESDEEKMFLDMYYEDLSSIPLPLDVHLISLAEQAIAGDKSAAN